MMRLGERMQRLSGPLGRQIVLLLIALLAVFVLGGGADGFRLGMDVAGGSRLVYKIDFGKYETVYDDPFALSQAKEQAQQIILTNIDARISALGVSDYSAYPQTLNGEAYIVVELGGVVDPDEAKARIGKTVELEFKLANKQAPDEATYAARKEEAAALLAASIVDSAGMEALGSNKQSLDVYYAAITNRDLTQLPTIYQNNSAVLDSMATGSVHSALLEGIYQSFPESYIAQGAEDLEGFVIVKLLDRTVEELEALDAQRLALVALAEDRSYDRIVSKTLPSAAQGQAVYEDGQVVLFDEVLFSGQVAYDAQVYSYDMALGYDAAVVQTELAAGTIASGVALVNEGWIDEFQLAFAVPGFVYVSDQQWYTLSDANKGYVVSVTDTKQIDEGLYASYIINDVRSADRQALLDRLYTKTTYSLEEIFVKDRNSWVTATDPETDEILNGAYFELARTSATQLGEPAVVIQFNDVGKRIFCHITEQSIGEQMAIFVGGELKTQPIIQDKICGGETQISGSFDRESAKVLAKDLNEGALPAPLILTQEESVSPTLGEQALRALLIAGLIGFVLIFVYMYRHYGVRMAVVSLLVLLSFVIYLAGLLKLMGFVVSLSGLAAVILTLGMSIDATILIFERVREERGHGKDWHDAIVDATARSWAPIRDGNLSTGLIALLLFTMGVNVFKGFGAMMLLSIFLILVLLVGLTKYLLLWLYVPGKNK